MTWRRILYAGAAATALVVPTRLVHAPALVVMTSMLLTVIASVNLRFQVPNLKDAYAEWSAVRLGANAPASVRVRTRTRLYVNVLRTAVVPALWLLGVLVTINAGTMGQVVQPPAPNVAVAALRVVLAVLLYYVVYGGEIAWAMIAWLDYRQRQRFGPPPS